ncbi:MAG: PD40 domain-containing protein [Myxococcales bacterium]|nr:PD40 domain-containing protein [Myxococcales bacterium]
MLPTLLTCAVALGASYDPDLTWRTLETEHFRIHFHQGIEQVADEYSLVAEDVWDTMTEEIAWTPKRKVHLVLVDRTDDANGFASAVPYNHITIYVTQPTPDSSLQLYEEWNRAILTHELTHILHIDTNEGLVHASRYVVGKIASTNDVSPAWVVEGFATFQETRHTSGGRGRASYPDMIKRTAVLEDAFPRLGNLDGFQPQLPSGNLRYLFGQDFIQYVADHAGRDVWTTWAHTYGAWWTPGVLMPTKRVFGKSLQSWYEDWKVASFEEYEAQAARVRAEGESQGRVVSDPDASCSAPAFSPDGQRLVWSCYDVRTGSAMWMADGEGYAPVKLIQDFGAGTFSWRADSKAFVYAGAHVVNQFNVWDDVYLFDVNRRSVSALTTGARARDPDFSPDGSKLVYVTNRAQDNQLEVMTVDRRRTPLTDHHDHTQYSQPRFSPDGQVLAVSMWREGRRDLWLVSPEGEPLRRLTADVAIDQDPAWSKDGKWLLFNSDRSGIPNVYAIELATERLWQVTNVTTGAARPAMHPDGTRFAYQRYSNDGWEVIVEDWDPSTFHDRGLLPAQIRYDAPIASLTGSPAPEVTASFEPGPASPERARALRPVEDPFPALSSLQSGRHVPDLRPQSAESIDTFADATVKDAFGEERDYPFHTTPHRYRPGTTLLPTFVLPYFQSTPFAPSDTFGFTCVTGVFCRGIQASVASSASDALRRYGWSGVLSYRTDVDWFGGGAAFTVNRFLPIYTVGVSSSASPLFPMRFYAPEPTTTTDTGTDTGTETVLFTTIPPTYYTEKRRTAYAVVAWPYKLRTTLFAQYAFSDRRPRYALPENVYFDDLPAIGRVGELSAGWRWSFSRPTPYAISVEDGRVANLVGSIVHPWLGTRLEDPASGDTYPFTQLQLTGEVRQYVVNPLIPNHVLAGRAAAGVTFGATDFFGNYVLGGNFGDSGFGVTPDEFRMLRGYAYGSDVGDLYWLAGLEYRFPLVRLERGAGTLPAYGRTLSGSLFVDAGNAFVNPSLATGVPSTLTDLGEAAIEQPLVGVGGELVWRAIIFYGIGLDGRLGYALSVRGDGITPVTTDEDGNTSYLEPFYARLGGSF